ncbi:hypothetical protein PO909_025782 [Leuciscus waleckii]
MEETAKNILLWHMALQLPYVPVFTEIGTTAHDDPSAFVFIQLRCEGEEKLRGKHCFGIRSMTFVIVCSPTLSLQLVIICMRWQNHMA